MAIKKLKYAGIGPRDIPSEIADMMSSVAVQMDHQGWILRSGRATGSDQAWEAGHRPASREIYLPWGGYNMTTNQEKNYFISPLSEQLEQAAKMTHPAWDKLSLGGQKLMMRNVSIILGPDLDDPVEFVAYWHAKKKPDGGTAHAINVAIQAGIPTFNIGFEEDQEAMSKFVDTYHQQPAD